MPRMQSKTDGDKQDPILIAAHETTARRRSKGETCRRDGWEGRDDEEVWVGTKGEKVEASVDEDPKRCCWCCCCCGLRCRDDEQLLLLLGRAWRLCPQEVGESASASPLSSARQIKKKKRTAANSAPRPPPPNPLSDFSQQKSCKKFVPIRG
ncbi:hypothetical protein L1887_59785 [Cichorium endivia]|nr:hypothetical protein L1887_59785 [Cichorium endivia]